MSSLEPKIKSSLSKPEGNITKTTTTITNDHEDPEILNSVTSLVYLKPLHSNEKLDKEEVLRGIRQRKRVNKVRASLQGLLGWFFSSKTVDKTSVKWVDDAFAAP